MLSSGLPLHRLPSILRNRSIGFCRRVGFTLAGPRNTLRAEDAIVICADPRGGSTWLYEMLSRINGVAGLWEPLHIGQVSHFRKIGFGWRHYIAENESVPAARKAFEDLFQGRCRDPYILHRTSFNSFRDAELLLVKFCRATQLLPWLSREFGFVRRPVHLVRHPCAIVASKIKYGAWDTVRPAFSEQDILSDPLMRPYADELQRINTIEARLAAVWALTNQVALNHPQREQRWLTVSYEGLVSSPVDTLSRVLSDWKLSLDADIEEIILRPSKTTLKSSPIALGEEMAQLSYWQKSLTPSQIRSILDTVEALGVGIYDGGVYPRL